MKSRLLRQFRTQFKVLPAEVRRLAKANYRLWSENPYHPSLHFKSVHPKSANVWSVRVGSDYRALALARRRYGKVVLDRYTRRIHEDSGESESRNENTEEIIVHRPVLAASRRGGVVFGKNGEKW